MQIGKILDYNNIIKKIIDRSTDVNSLVKFRLLGMLKQFEPIIDNFNQIRDEAIEKYGSPHPQGGYGIIQPNRDDFENENDYKKALEEYEKKYTQFTDEINEVLNSESDIQIKKFNYKDIIDAGISSDYLVVLYDLIEE